MEKDILSKWNKIHAPGTNQTSSTTLLSAVSQGMVPLIQNVSHSFLTSKLLVPSSGFQIQPNKGP